VYCYYQLQARPWLSSRLEAGTSDDFVQFLGGLAHLVQLHGNRVEIPSGAAREPSKSSMLITYSGDSLLHDLEDWLDVQRRRRCRIKDHLHVAGKCSARRSQGASTSARALPVNSVGSAVPAFVVSAVVGR
jgi:hypothetical protein